MLQSREADRVVAFSCHQLLLQVMLMLLLATRQALQGACSSWVRLSATTD
jgi:hypothetical protein